MIYVQKLSVSQDTIKSYFEFLEKEAAFYNLDNEENVLASNDPKILSNYGSRVIGCNKRKFADKLLAINNIDSLLDFARLSEDLSQDIINDIEDIMINSNDVDYIYSFAKLDNVNKERCFEKTLELCQDVYIIQRFLDDIEFNKNRYKGLLLFI